MQSWYSSDTFQTWKSFCYSFRFSFQNTVQIRSRHGFHSDTYSDTVQIHSRHGFHYDTHSDSTFRYASDTNAILTLIWFQLTDIVQQSFLDGIYKPISNNILSSLQMEFLSPFSLPSHHRVQISGHSSVQSSSAFESRMEKLVNLTLQA